MDDARFAGPDQSRIASAKLATAPRVHPANAFYEEAYSDLSTERPLTMGGVGPIPMSAVINYAEYYDLTTYESDRLWRVIKAVDRVELALKARDRSRDENTSTG